MFFWLFLTGSEAILSRDPSISPPVSLFMRFPSLKMNLQCLSIIFSYLVHYIFIFCSLYSNILFIMFSYFVHYIFIFRSLYFHISFIIFSYFIHYTYFHVQGGLFHWYPPISVPKTTNQLIRAAVPVNPVL